MNVDINQGAAGGCRFHSGVHEREHSPEKSA
jgi:hypothetical protein